MSMGLFQEVAKLQRAVEDLRQCLKEAVAVTCGMTAQVNVLAEQAEATPSLGSN